MKKYIILAITALLVGCGSSGSSGGSKSVQYGTISFAKSTINITPSGTNTETLTLINSSNVNNLIVSLSLANTSIASLSTSSCTLSSSGSNNQCSIIITGLAAGTTNIIATASYTGHSYSIAPATVNVSSIPVTSSGITMSVNGLTQTIYAGQTYNATFKFTNNTSSAINLAQMVITGASGLGVSINPAPCSNRLLPVGASCSITANGIHIATANTLVPLDFTLNTTGGSTAFYNFNMDVVAVTQRPGYAAYRITNLKNPGHTLYIVTLNKNSAGTQELVVFDPSTGIGSLSPSATYQQATVTVPNTSIGVTLYQNNFSDKPGGIGGVMYVSLDKPLTITSGVVSPAPWVPTDPSHGIIFSQYEPNVWSDAVSGDLRAILDITDINFVGLTQSFHGLDINTGNNLASGYIQEPYASLTTSEMYNQIQNVLVQNYTASWGVSSTFFLASTNPNQWIMLFGLVNDLGANPIVYPVGFNQNLYTQYVQDLWSYYTNNTIYIDASEISNTVTPGAHCILQATSTGSLSAPTMEVEPCSNNSICPNNNCPVTGATGPKSWSWGNVIVPGSLFTAADFVGGAANSSTSTLYGTNKTYKSMGKYISAAQSVGFLPYCSQPNIIYGPNTLGQPAYTSKYWTNQYSTCLTNSGSYGDSVINQYDKVFHQYIPLNYAWAYDDALGISSAVTTDPTKFGFTMEVHQFQ